METATMKTTLAVSQESVRQITSSYDTDAALIDAALRCLEARFAILARIPGEYISKVARSTYQLRLP